MFNVACEPIGKTEFSSNTKKEQILSHREENCMNNLCSGQALHMSADRYGIAKIKFSAYTSAYFIFAFLYKPQQESN